MTFKRGNTIESQKKVNFQEKNEQIQTPLGLMKKPTLNEIGSGPLKLPYSGNNQQQLSGGKGNEINKKKHGTNHPSGDSKMAAHQSES